MDPFGQSPAEPGSVMSSLFGGGGQTPASNQNHGVSSILNPNSIMGNSILGPGSLMSGTGPGSVFGLNPHSVIGQTPQSNVINHGPGSILGGLGGSVNGPGSVLNPSSVLNGPGSVLNNLNNPPSVLNNVRGPDSVMNSQNGPGSVYAEREPASVMNLHGIPQYGDAPPSVMPLAVPMTPLQGDFQGNRDLMPASNIPATVQPPTPMSVAIDVPSPTLQNIVSTVNLGVQLDLKKIALHARNAEYNPKRFAAVIMRIREPRTTALIFSSGKMVCTGAKSEEASRLAARKYARIIQKLGFDAKFTEFKVQNMVGSCDVKFPILLEALCIKHAQFSTYEPELFPGLIYRMVKPRVVLLIFVSGKVVITGAKFKRDIDEAFNQIYPILKGFKK
ncbi:unnamed protein product [Bursaphelenchus okinawaensis]|uniref:TATA-box-binding protein n=1 Tax=Bursaphelenchus okinawaensis TaxID=465554 RepID=A0A811KIL7_9BILA|nr:unnamed protein product [Bursaphelenchus okinawaensis]CAG9103638.1 unnamed protein product [Bursaphelenchus okinawaensis]